jgi:hypothetical protein
MQRFQWFSNYNIIYNKLYIFPNLKQIEIFDKKSVFYFNSWIVFDIQLFFNLKNNFNLNFIHGIYLTNK